MTEGEKKQSLNLDKVQTMAREFGWDGCIVYGFKEEKAHRLVWSDDKRVVTKLRLMMDYMWQCLGQFFEIFTRITTVKDDCSPE